MTIDEPATTPVGGDPQVVPGQKWLRGMLHGQIVVDSRDYLNVWEVPYWPWWFFRTDAIAGELVEPAAPSGKRLPEGAVAHDLLCAGERLGHAARTYPGHPVLDGWVAIEFASMDHWFEEDVEVFVHPRSPYTRIDALASSRHVVVSLHGVELANSHKPTVLFETGAPARFYLPMTDAKLDLFVKNDRRTSCPYKGDADSFDVQVGDELVRDLAWTYVLPRPESAPIAGLICFFNESVDIVIDGVRQTRPRSHFA